MPLVSSFRLDAAALRARVPLSVRRRAGGLVLVSAEAGRVWFARFVFTPLQSRSCRSASCGSEFAYFGSSMANVRFVVAFARQEHGFSAVEVTLGHWPSERNDHEGNKAVARYETQPTMLGFRVLKLRS